MKATVKRMISGEKGKVLILVLILLVVGGLVMTPLLGLMQTGLIAGQVYERKSAELYAADAGIEKGIWHLQQGGSADDVLEFTLNGKDVEVEIEHLNPGECNKPALYEIVANAGGDGSGTTVEAHVTGITVYLDPGEVFRGFLGANVYVEGDLSLDEAAEIQGNVIVTGDLELCKVALIGGVVCVGGDLKLNEEANIQMDVYVGGNMVMHGGQKGSWVDGDVYVGGNVEMTGKSELLKDLWAGGDSVEVDRWATIMGDVHVTDEEVVDWFQQDDEKNIYGEILEDYKDHACPLGFTKPEILLWLII